VIVGFIGATGAGKSTLLDIIMGLLSPTDGQLIIDGEVINSNEVSGHFWRANIAHVPQTIFLADSSIAENIAFGVSLAEIDFSRVQEAAKLAQIHKEITQMGEGYSTRVGERGIRLSGGQMQRIGIARALYKRAQVLILDEATSALDVKTEEAVMEGIDALEEKPTLLIIAHRISTLKTCNKIIELQDSRIKRILSYKELVE
jgi:ATP-binding cassette subfamily B protein